MTTHTFLATTSRGAEDALALELRRMGLQRVHPERNAVRFMGPLQDGYRACLWSRVASRVLLRIGRFEAMRDEALYAGLQAIDWSAHLAPTGTLWVDFIGGSKFIRHNQFGARRCKDAIVDQLRTPAGQRPTVERDDPDLRLNVHLRHGVVTVSVDLSGQALHWRTPDRQTTDAPLRETLAATLLMMADWPKAARDGLPFLDPMCGSGTLVLEAAAMARDRAPGLMRRRWGFSAWRGHDRAVWKALLDEAHERRRAGQAHPSRFQGRDQDPAAVRAARHNAQRLGLKGIDLRRAPMKSMMPFGDQPGMVFTNPPYGERLGTEEEAAALFGRLGDTLRWKMLGWSAYVLAPVGPLSRSVGLRTRARHVVFNGPIECRLLAFDIRDVAPQRAEEPPTG
ncbi:MAG: THUMP domain-containing protein [Myxococcota bacterium]